jgi:alpha-tubulin suppressor-like RCC1 family protein
MNGNIIVSQFSSNSALVNGAVYCWGDIENCGIDLSNDPTNIISEKNYITRPTLIKELASNTTFLSSSDMNYNAVKDGKIYTWGQAFSLNQKKRSPIELTEYGNDNLMGVGNYQNNFCAIKKDKTAKCTFKYIQSPNLSEFLTSIDKVEMGGSCICFLKNKSVYCLSEEAASCQGVGLSAKPNVLNEIVELKNTTIDISSYGGFYCALSIEGNINCWGNIEFGLDPNKILTPSFYSKVKTLENISRPQPLNFNSKNATKLKFDGMRICVKDSYQGMSCYGFPMMTLPATNNLKSDQNFVPIIHSVPMSDFSFANGDRLCSVNQNGEIKCMGDNMLGRLGIGIYESSTHYYSSPQSVKFNQTN